MKRVESFKLGDVYVVKPKGFNQPAEMRLLAVDWDSQQFTARPVRVDQADWERWKKQHNTNEMVIKRTEILKKSIFF
ncbi:hypothetical protein [Enterococcus sp. LJL90]